MNEVLKKILLYIIAAILVVLIALFINYTLADKSNLSSDEGNKVVDKNPLISGASVSKTFDYKNIMNCNNIETNKGCVINDFGNELIIYNEKVSNDGTDELIKAIVKLNGKQVNILNESFKASELSGVILNKEGIFVTRTSEGYCNEILDVADLNGIAVTPSLGDYKLCKMELINDFVNLTLVHKNITGSDYVCSDIDNDLIATGDIDAELVSEARVSENKLNLVTVSAKRFSEYCKGNRGV